MAYRGCSLNIYIPVSGISGLDSLLSLDIPDKGELTKTREHSSSNRLRLRGVMLFVTFLVLVGALLPSAFYRHPADHEWRSTIIASITFLVVTIILAATFLPPLPRRRAGHLRLVLGACLATLVVAAVTLAAISLWTNWWQGWAIWLARAVAALAGASFILLPYLLIVEDDAKTLGRLVH
ncbi:MAG: hypothetical protein PHV43_01715 [Candidatus Colwellbacteria bacterium]|nr:hypothetical protein [Candidatus Colwellbacteria bacterium]